MAVRVVEKNRTGEGMDGIGRGRVRPHTVLV